MKIRYDPQVDALDIRFVEAQVACETVHLSDQVALDFGPDGRLVAVEILDASELIPELRKGIVVENLAIATAQSESR